MFQPSFSSSYDGLHVHISIYTFFPPCSKRNIYFEMLRLSLWLFWSLFTTLIHRLVSRHVSWTQTCVYSTHMNTTHWSWDESEPCRGFWLRIVSRYVSGGVTCSLLLLLHMLMLYTHLNITNFPGWQQCFLKQHSLWLLLVYIVYVDLSQLPHKGINFEI